MKVLIVGAGPTGLTAAIELARRGVLPVIVDRRHDASTLSRAVGITPRSLELLSHSGVAQRLIEEGIAMDGLCVYRGTSLALSMPLHSERTYFPTVLGLPQDRTESVMAEILTSLGVAVQYGIGLETLSNREDAVVARFSDGTENHFDHVVGADGIGSTVRQSAGIAYPGADLDQTWSIADVDAEAWLHPGKITLVRAGAGTVMVVAPMGGNRYRLVASHENALQALPLPLNVTTVHREGTFNHCHSPVGGRGMNLGITDATELAKRMVEGDLSGYSSLRHSEGEEAISITERGRKMTAGSNWRRRLAFRALLTAASIAGPVKRRLGRFLVEF